MGHKKYFSTRTWFTRELVMAIDDQEELEVTLRHHQDLLLQNYNGFKFCRFDEISAEPDDFSDADPLSCHSVGMDHKAVAVDPRSTKGKPRRRNCLAKCISLVFLLGAGAAIYTVWQLGIVGSLKHRVNSASANSVESEFFGLPTYTPSMQPSISPEPTVAPTKIPSRQPSVSFVPTTGAPSQMPSLSPKPSGSMLPSSLPSVIPSSFPSEPTASPWPSLSPTQHPSLVPSDASSSTPSMTQSDAPRICNGLASNCNRRANDIMYATSHNAMSSQVDGFIAFNHLKNMEDSMEAGFRGFLIDSCDCGEDGIKFCHEVCAGGTRDPKTLFLSVVTFMYKNPHDIIVIELQVGDDSLWGLWEQTPSQFRDLAYTHTGDSDPWPTLNELIDMGRRIIVLQHNGPDCDIPGQCPEGVQGYVS